MENEIIFYIKNNLNIELDAEENFSNYVLIDSLFMLTMIVELMEKFEIEISKIRFQSEDFLNVKSIAHCLNKVR